MKWDSIKPDLPKARQLIHEGSLALSEVERNGLRIDVAKLDGTIEEVSLKIKELQKKCAATPEFEEWVKAYGSKADLGNRNQLAHVLFERLDYTCTEFTEKQRRPKVDGAALSRINTDFTLNYLALERYKSISRTFLLSIRREVQDGFLHAMLDLNTTKTYRSSSSKPNSQNFPNRDPELRRLVRSCFIPRDGHALVELDYSGIEVRVAACYNKDPMLIQYIKDPTKDMHRDMAAQIYKCKISQVSKDMRQCSKGSFVFPQFYGSFYLDCAKGLWREMLQDKLTVGDVPIKRWLKRKGIRGLGACESNQRPQPGTFEKHIKEVESDFWDRRFKVYSEWKEEWYSRYLKRGWLASHTGFLMQGDYSRNDVINYPIQGAAFHCLLWSLTQLVSNYLKRYKFKTKIVGQIHDSIIADVPLNELADFLEIAVDVMVTKMVKTMSWIIVPIEVEAEMSEVSWFEKKPIPLDM